MKTVYIADDGKEFDNYVDCKNYEIKNKLAGISFFRYHNGVYEDITDWKDIDDIYENADRVIIGDDRLVKNLIAVGEQCGYCSWESDIDSFGVWDFNENGYEKVGDINVYDN